MNILVPIQIRTLHEISGYSIYIEACAPIVLGFPSFTLSYVTRVGMSGYEVTKFREMKPVVGVGLPKRQLFEGGRCLY